MTSNPQQLSFSNSTDAEPSTSGIRNVESYSNWHLEYVVGRCSLDHIRGFSGASAGAASGIVACPLDVIKTKLQGRHGLRLWSLDSTSIRRPFQDRGLIGTGRMIWREEGLRGMYRGLGPTILGYLPTWAIFFTVYHRTDEICSSKFGVGREWISSCASAVAAGACSTIFTNPLWVIKTRLMSQTGASSQGAKPPREYKSVLDTAWRMYRNEGIISFYSGLTPALLGVTHLAIQFPLYEQLKRYFTGAGLGRWNEEEKPQVLGILGASVMSKICASLPTYPHEVMRTRLQTQYGAYNTIPLEGRMLTRDSEQPRGVRRPLGATSCCAGRSGSKLPLRYQGLIGTFKTILREEGWRAFYAGMGTSMIRAIPASATTILVYEIVLRALQKSRKEDQRKLELQKLLE